MGYHGLIMKILYVSALTQVMLRLLMSRKIRSLQDMHVLKENKYMISIGVGMVLLLALKINMCKYSILLS